MAADTISKKKIDEVNRLLRELGVTEDDWHEEFIKGSGSGGQKINKTNSCVQLTFIKTGLVIKCQKTRSREQNRFFARRLLLEKLQKEILGAASAESQRIRKLKAQKRKRSKRAKEKVLQAKKEVAQKKVMRRKPAED